ncbi:hypothetical protein BC936DRAFT_141464 [Jimgerdemannia flammicorona]|uniref:Coiled-coil domain-containing protein n=1 Tax=Jimgerdemannia flammicorona TaxID=994334 RepID=A0A433A255_9FUNG|nr:hypothetical protein BC936DRAFT_141464 [Jimgerdemannia flammicorona]
MMEFGGSMKMLIFAPVFCPHRYTRREMEIMKKEHPGLRRTQLKDLIYKNFQVVLEYNAEKQDEAKLIDARRKEIENRLKS